MQMWKFRIILYSLNRQRHRVIRLLETSQLLEQIYPQIPTQIPDLNKRVFLGGKKISRDDVNVILLPEFQTSMPQIQS